MHASIGTMSGCGLNILLDPVFVLYFGVTAAFCTGSLTMPTNHVSDILLDPVFVLYFGMGAAGAGLATFVSNCAACLYFVVLLFIRRKESMVCMNPVMARPKKEIVLEICAVGIPASIQNLLYHAQKRKPQAHAAQEAFSIPDNLLILDRSCSLNQKLKEKIMESLSAVLPITGIVLVVSIFLVPLELATMFMFLTPHPPCMAVTCISAVQMPPIRRASAAPAHGTAG